MEKAGGKVGKSGEKWGHFFAKWPPPAILDDQKSLSIEFLAISDQYATFIISRRRRRPGDGRYCNAPRPSVCPSVRLSVRLSVTFSFRTVTQKRIAVFSRNFAGTCTCIVFDIDGMLFEFFMNFLNI